MVIVLVCVILLLILAIIGANYINNILRRKHSQISLKESLAILELPVVTFTSGRKKLNFILDTGSNNSVINESILKDISYTEFEEKEATIGLEGNSIPTSKCKFNIKYNKLSFDETFSVINLDAAFSNIKESTGVQLHGILGNKFFENHKYILDFSKLIAYIK